MLPWAMLKKIAQGLLLVLCMGFAACSTPPKAEPPADSYDVVLLPTEEFNYEQARQLAQALSLDTDLRIRAMLNIGTRDWKPFGDPPQYDPRKLLNLARPAIAELKKSYGGVLYILLTHRDLNPEGSGLRFVFSENYPVDKVSVVSSARMTFGNRGQPAGADIVNARLRKMILRTIGLQYFQLERTADPKDLMFSPLMSLDGLDGMEARLNPALVQQARAARASGNSRDTARYAEFRWSLFNQPSFNPYGTDVIEKSLTNRCRTSWQEGKADAAFSSCQEALKVFPASILAHRMLADMFQTFFKHPSVTAEQRERIATMEKMHRAASEGLLQSILASGNGQSAETAYKVITVGEEYIVLGYLGLQATQQSLLEQGERRFDVIAARAKDGSQKDVFFDVTPFMKKALEKTP